ncbi:MAG TPA: flagellar basal-body MS-ring/collar protein FliF [Gemmataceae bacterium]|nr:flagellar basal-body MS-ring/collar protein FliF [Gemmataceae bacterium]
MEFFRRLWQQLRQIWQGLSWARRVGILFLSSICVALIVGVAYWASQPDYRVLYSNLSPEDAGAITSKLQATGVSYRLTSGGQTVLVPAEQVAQVRVDLAAEGLPAKGGKGFELFDTSALSTTPLAERVNFVRALQAELAKTIMQLDSVASARVHIVLPDQSPFIREQLPAKASIMLRLRPGAVLSRSTSSGIVALVARSVEGLTPENITLVDANGRLLSESTDPDAGAAEGTFDYRRQLEKYLASKAEEMLTQALGPQRAIVRVTAEINSRRLREKKENYRPDDRVVINEKVTSSRSTTPVVTARGPAGTASNLPPARGAATGTGTGTSQDETTETSYVVSKVTQEFEEKVGTIERLTIAALVDLSKGEGGSGPSITKQEVEEIIRQAVGFKVNRDEIKVSDVRLSGPPDLHVNDTEWEKIQLWQNVANIVRNASLGIAALVGLILGWMVFRRLRLAAPPPPPPPGRMSAAERLTEAFQRNPNAVVQALSIWLENLPRPPQQGAT